MLEEWKVKAWEKKTLFKFCSLSIHSKSPTQNIQGKKMKSDRGKDQEEINYI